MIGILSLSSSTSFNSKHCTNVNEIMKILDYVAMNNSKILAYLL